MNLNHLPISECLDERDACDKIRFACGVLEILKETGLFNFLIDRAIADLDAVVVEVSLVGPSGPKA